MNAATYSPREMKPTLAAVKNTMSHARPKIDA
jgi:hypothetical protein